MSENETSARVQSGKGNDHWNERYLTELFEAFHSLGNIEEFQRFFEDLCTPAELRSMADRWRVAQLLEQGLSYRVINEKTGVSTATITRVARSLTYGAGGYLMVFKRLQGEKK